MSTRSPSVAPGDRPTQGVDMVRYHHRVAAAIALIVAVTAAAPALARPELGATAGQAQPSIPAGTNPCSEVCSGSGYAVTSAGAALAHNPTGLAVARAGSGYGYGSTPTASAGSNNPRSEVVSGGGYGNPTAPAAVVRVVAPSDGFDWGDAGIGAGCALALMTLVIGGILGAANIRRRAARAAA
jgi:hypothetical protein